MRAAATAVAVFGLATFGYAALWMRRHLVLVTVTGRSMEPTLHDGNRVLIRRRRPHEITRGAIVVLAPPKTGVKISQVWRMPSDGWNIKRVAALPGDRLPEGIPAPDDTGLVPANTVVVLSDNPIGVDSRTWGPYPADGVVGTTVIARPRPADATTVRSAP